MSLIQESLASGMSLRILRKDFQSIIEGAVTQVAVSYNRVTTYSLAYWLF